MIKFIQQKLIYKWDILYALYWATSGQVAIAKLDWAINQAVLCIRSETNNYFLYSRLNFQKNNILQTFLQGWQWNLSAEIIKSLKIVVPFFSEQEKIASFLSQIDAKISEYVDEIEQNKEVEEVIVAGIVYLTFLYFLYRMTTRLEELANKFKASWKKPNRDELNEFVKESLLLINQVNELYKKSFCTKKRMRNCITQFANSNRKVKYQSYETYITNIL